MPKSTDEIPIEQTSLFLFIGAADSGKSFAATSFGLAKDPFNRPCYVMELDGRLAGLRGRPIVYDDYNDTEGAVGVLNRLITLRESCIASNRAPFHTLILDSFTSFNDFCMSDSLYVTEEKREQKKEGGRMRGELLMPTVEDYGYEAEAVRKLLWENLSVLKKYCNVIVTAHETEYYKPVRTKPGEPTRSELAGYKVLARDKIAAKLPTKFDEIYHFLPKEVVISQKTVRRQVTFQDMVARTSYPALAASTQAYDITGKEFYPFWRELIGGAKK
jgi:hypothetical protein